MATENPLGHELLRPPPMSEFGNISPSAYRFLQQLAQEQNYRAFSPRAFYNLAATKTNSGIVTSQSMGTTTNQVGSRTVPPNFFKKGRGFRFYVCGFYSTAATAGNANVDFKIGSTTYSTTGTFALPTSVSGTIWRIFGQVGFRADGVSGQAIGQTGFEHDNELAIPTWKHVPMTVTSPVTIDTTQELTIDFEWTATAAGTSISTTCYTLEVFMF